MSAALGTGLTAAELKALKDLEDTYGKPWPWAAVSDYVQKLRIIAAALRRLSDPVPPDLVALSAKATAGDFSVVNRTNIYAGDGYSAISLASNALDTHTRNNANAEFLVACVNYVRSLLPPPPEGTKP